MNLQEAVDLLKKHFEILDIYYQTKTESYLRYLDLFDIYIRIVSSKFFQIGEKFRLFMGRNRLFPIPNSFSAKPLSGDYKITPLSQEDNNQEVYIFVCQGYKS